jgi:hypothetical protein
VTPCPEAVYDCMAICESLETITGGAGELEIAHLAYLACLLSVYEGDPPSEWGYDFAVTPSMAPFSRELSKATHDLIVSGLLQESPDGICLTDRGRRNMEVLANLKRFDRRRVAVDAACKSASAIPLPLVTESMAAEPQLKRARELDSTRSLLDEAGRHSVMEHFRALAIAVPPVNDLFVPAVVWLTYLLRGSEMASSNSEEEI